MNVLNKKVQTTKIRFQTNQKTIIPTVVVLVAWYLIDSESFLMVMNFFSGIVPFLLKLLNNVSNNQSFAAATGAFSAFIFMYWRDILKEKRSDKRCLIKVKEELTFCLIELKQNVDRIDAIIDRLINDNKITWCLIDPLFYSSCLEKIDVLEVKNKDTQEILFELKKRLYQSNQSVKILNNFFTNERVSFDGKVLIFRGMEKTIPEVCDNFGTIKRQMENLIEFTEKVAKTID